MEAHSALRNFMKRTVVIHTFFFAQYFTGGFSMLLKQLGFHDFPTTLSMNDK
jgi:hypothetical protein